MTDRRELARARGAYERAEHIATLRYLETQYLPGGPRDIKGAIRAAIGALADHPCPTAAEQGEGHAERLFDAFMAGDVARLTTTALPGSFGNMQPSYQRAWIDLASALVTQPNKADAEGEAS